MESRLKVGERALLIPIVAPLKFGKTSLMLKYIEIVKKYEDIIPVYIDLRRNLEPVWTLSSAVLKGEKLKDLYEEARKSARRLDVLFDAINDELKRIGKWLFVFFDEFHLLPRAVRAEGFLKELPDEASVFDFFRAVAEGRRISYIVCGSVVESLMDAISVWGGRFQLVYLGPFAKLDAINMMKTLFKEGGMRVPDEFIEILCDAAGYHPFYMQFMGSEVYAIGKADRLSLREAKKRLWEYIRPVFDEYVRRLWRENKRYVTVLQKVARKEELTAEEAILALDLIKKEFFKAGNGGFFYIDPLFERYMAALHLPRTPPDISVVGHWAERIVGNYLLSCGYLPYYSHDSRGAFDIYVRVKGVDVGIQVRYSSTGEVRLSSAEAERILKAAEEMRWKPILALVSKEIEFFSEIRPGVYRAGEGMKDFEKAILNS